MLLFGKPVVESLREKTKAYLASLGRDDLYVAHFLLNNDAATQVYAKLKGNYASSVGITSRTYEMRKASSVEVLQSIEKCNADEACVGIIVQLPVAENLLECETDFLTAVSPQKDIDGLSWIVFWNSLAGKWNFIPATPRAVFEVLAYYGYDELQGKTVAVISQSNLIWKPVALELMKRWASVLSCNERSGAERVAEICRMSDVIISATGVPGLLSASSVGGTSCDISRKDKVIVDVGRGIKDGKAVGDTDREALAEAGAHITPVPWGVWPVTIACVFDNIRFLSVKI